MKGGPQKNGWAPNGSKKKLTVDYPKVKELGRKLTNIFKVVELVGNGSPKVIVCNVKISFDKVLKKLKKPCYWLEEIRKVAILCLQNRAKAKPVKAQLILSNQLWEIELTKQVSILTQTSKGSNFGSQSSY